MPLPTLRLAVASALVLAASANGLHAADTTFTSGLPAWAQNADGLSKLSSEQLKSLNDAVSHDITLAQQGQTVAFAKSFSERRTEKERSALGLTQLSFDQLNHLNDDVAHAIAYRPQLSVTPAGDAPLVNAGAVASFKRPWQTHGEVTMTVGGSKRGSFYGGSVEVDETDPSGDFTLSVAISQYKGKGLPLCYGGLDGEGYGYGPYRYGSLTGYPYGW